MSHLSIEVQIKLVARYLPDFRKAGNLCNAVFFCAADSWLIFDYRWLGVGDILIVYSAVDFTAILQHR